VKKSIRLVINKNLRSRTSHNGLRYRDLYNGLSFLVLHNGLRYRDLYNGLSFLVLHNGLRFRSVRDKLKSRGLHNGLISHDLHHGSPTLLWRRLTPVIVG